MEYKEALEKVGTYTLEAMMARMDRIIKRLWIVILLLIVLLVASNCAWLWYESSFDEAVVTTTTQTVKQDNTDGSNSFVGGDVNGKPDSKDSD